MGQTAVLTIFTDIHGPQGVKCYFALKIAVDS